MTIKPIRNDDDLKKMFRRLEKIFQAEEGTAQADERDVLVTIAGAYENKHHHLGPADPVEAIKFRTEQEGLTPRDLEPFIGPMRGSVEHLANQRLRRLVDDRVGMRGVGFGGFVVYRGLSETVLGSAFKPSQVID